MTIPPRGRGGLPPSVTSKLPPPKREMVQPKPGPSQLEIELGVSQNLPFSTFLGLQGEVPRTDQITIDQLIAMRRTDGQARALYRLITLPIRSALRNSLFQPDEDGDNGEAEFLTNMFEASPVAGGMVTPWNLVMAQMLMSVFDGFSPFEQVYHVPDKGPISGKIALKKLAYRPASTIHFLATEQGEFNGFRQRAGFLGQFHDITIQPENGFYVAANEEENPFYGVSYFTSAFYHYDKKVKLYYLAHLAAQVRATGLRAGKYPANYVKNVLLEFKKSLADFGVAQSMLIPDGYDIVELGRNFPSFDYISLINHHNNQMSKSVLAAFFDENQGGQVSLVDFGNQGDSLFIMMLQSIMDDVANRINNDLTPKFIDWNFSSEHYPKFAWGPFTDEQKSAINSTFQTLATAGQSLTTTKEFFRELEKHMADEMGLEIDYDAIEEREEVEAARTQAMESQKQQGGDLDLQQKQLGLDQQQKYNDLPQDGSNLPLDGSSNNSGNVRATVPGVMSTLETVAHADAEIRASIERITNGDSRYTELFMDTSALVAVLP